MAFIQAVLDDLATAYRIDPRGVFATGLSNGAVMAYRLASELSDRIAAVALVAGRWGRRRATPGARAGPPLPRDRRRVSRSRAASGRSVFKTDFYSVSARSAPG